MDAARPRSAPFKRAVRPGRWVPLPPTVSRRVWSRSPALNAASSTAKGAPRQISSASLAPRKLLPPVSSQTALQQVGLALAVRPADHRQNRRRHKFGLRQIAEILYPQMFQAHQRPSATRRVRPSIVTSSPATHFLPRMVQGAPLNQHLAALDALLGFAAGLAPAGKLQKRLQFDEIGVDAYGLN